MNRVWIILPCLFFAGCATQLPALPDPQGLFADSYFALRPTPTADEVFAVSGDMKRYLSEHIGRRPGWHDRAMELARILRGDTELKLTYDSSKTRIAAESFEERAGNCLSLVIMTGALARELDLGVRYFRVVMPDVWSSDGDLLLANQHVNISLTSRAVDHWPGEGDFRLMVDFLPPEDLYRQVRSEIEENTVVAMFLNNRAVEHLVARRLDDAYWSARAAIEADRGFLPAYNTLGVVYLRDHRLAESERVLAAAATLEPENPQILSNLELVYRGQGRTTAADQLAARRIRIEPVPPYHYLNKALDAVRGGDYVAARDLLLRELRREPNNHEVLFALAVASVNLGNVKEARRYLTIARDNSTTRRSREIYMAKLELLRSVRPQ
jgi:tetratricopeptide (TPR) repeat protein